MPSPTDVELTPALEAELVRRAAGGDGRAFEVLTARYYRPVGGYLLKRVEQADVVEDLAQDTFLEAFRAIKQGRIPEKFSTWLFGIAHNISGAWLRRRCILSFSGPPAEEIPAPDPPPGLEEIEEQERLQRELAAGIAELSEEVREMLRRKHQDGQTCEEIAGTMGRPVGTIKSLLSRAYKALRARLCPDEE
jgi:RNA polymerase sigma-70 factor (ECF subfamily)